MTARIPRGNGSSPDGCPAAAVALERADHASERADEALDGYRSVYEAMGRLVAEFAGLRAEVRAAMGSRTLARDAALWWRRWALGIVGVVLGALLTAAIFAALGLHR